MKINDANGVWEVTEGNGCINKCLVEPSEQYLAEHPEYSGTASSEPTLEEIATGLTDAMQAIMELSLE